MKSLKFLFVCVLLLAGQPVLGQTMFGTLTSSRPTDQFVTAANEARFIALDVWSREALLGKPVMLEFQYAAGEVFRYHNPRGTLEVTPAVGQLSDISDLRLVNLQGQTVAVARIATTLPESFDSQVYPGSVTQVLFEPVPGASVFKGETLFAVARVGSSFATDDVVGVGIRKIVFRDSAGAIEAYEPYPNTSFISHGATSINPAVLTVSVSPATPKCVPAADNVVAAKFQVRAKSIRPGNPMLWRGWQLEFEVPTGTAKALGVIKVLNEAGEVVKEDTVILKGNNPRRGLLSLTAPDSGSTSGYSLKSEETLAVTFSTTVFTGADITITSVEFLAADFGGTNLQYGDLVSSNGQVSTTVHVQEASAPSEGGGGGGPGPGVVVPQPPPVVVEELPFAGQQQLLYILESEGGVRKAMWVIAFLENPAPAGFNRILWDTPSYMSYHDLEGVVQNGDGTTVGFRLPAEFTGAEPQSLLGLGAKIRFFRLSRP